MSDDTRVVYGPIVGVPGSGGIIYSVTLGNGYVVTSPSGFGDDAPQAEPRPLPRRLTAMEMQHA